ncbi:MAG: NAD-glutamate dehydrogenase domain-containing protein, partial [Planctomycetota bacterium]
MRTSSRLADLIGAAVNLPVTKSDPALLRRFVDWVDEACDERYRLHYEDVVLVEQLARTYEFLERRTRHEILIRTEPVRYGDGDAITENTMLEVALADQPFVVDTLRLLLEFTGLRVLASVYLSIPVQRDRSGVVRSLETDGPKANPEIVARFEIAGALHEEFRATLEGELRNRLEISRQVVGDFKKMKTCLRSVSRSYRRLASTAPEDVVEMIGDARALVEWLLDDNFVLMGISFYPKEADGPPLPDTTRELGYSAVLDDERARCGDRISAMARGKLNLDSWVASYKSQEESLIHRAGKIDNFLLRSYDSEGEHEGTYHVRGLFTFRAIKTPGSQIPLVRLKLHELRMQAGHRRGSISWKSYTNAFDSIPVEFLFEAPTTEIAQIIESILYVEKAKELRTHVTVDDENRKALYFLVLPRHGYSENLRRHIESVLIDGLGATYSDSRVYFGKFDTILLTFFFTAAESFREFSREELDEAVRAVAGSWEERFFRALSGKEGSARAQLLWDRYHRGFSEEYQLQHSSTETVSDVQQLESIPDGEGGIALDIVANQRDREQRRVRLRMYQKQNIYLSRILPVLDNFGLQIVDQSHHRVMPASGDELHIDSFRVAGVDSPEHSLLAQKELVLDALRSVFADRVANDPLNRLTVEVGLGWRDVDLLRAYLHYLRQLGVPSTFQFMRSTLRQYTDITRALLDLYATKFDPHLELTMDERRECVKTMEAEITAALHNVPSSAQDQFFRTLLNLFSCTVRTNRYQLSEAGDHRIVFKIDATQLIVGDQSRVWREIYVHHYSMEGVHLRGGRLARGGIRWSDRPSDFREEVLGLMRTQMVKNVLIVPVGAKGGFVVRKVVENPDDLRRQADEMYRIFINGILDVTDNVVDGKIVPPPSVVRYDGDDAYLVVAADKGTAHLSDTANQISQQRGFWLGDAFASGGSQGYDHKALGITARGAWEGVVRHFREAGIDPAHDEFTVVGIGDMSGDVFGNGMLLSEKIRLLAAFNHQHIFLDPDPDARRSFEERLRLSRLPRSTWKDYGPEVLSGGGGVYSRNAKHVRLSPQASKMLGMEPGEHPPEEVICRILMLKVDLLWNGGVGTYIKASTEDNRDVGDMSNEAIRVSASKVRTRVIGEGGNLGATQMGRVQYALNGGRVNTDFVDNSAGVNCSDHEVNLKILLESQIAAGKMTREERNELLQQLADEVCAAVLASNRDQGLLLSLDERRSRQDLFSFDRAIKALEDRDWVVRDRDNLPNLETILRRHAQGLGMTRPELAQIAAYCKMDLYEHLLRAPEESLPDLSRFYRSYFPQRLLERCGAELSEHLLGRQIALTMVTNQIIDHAGASFFFDVERETGADLGRIVTAYLLAHELFDGDAIKNVIEGGDNSVPATAQYAAIHEVEEAARRAVAWLLAAHHDCRLTRIAAQRDEYRAEMARYEEIVAQQLPKPERQRQASMERHYREQGFDKETAKRLTRFGYMTAGLCCVDIAIRTKRDLADVVQLYYRIGQASYIIPFVRSWEENSFSGRWDSLALRITRNSMLESLGALAKRQVETIDVTAEGRVWVERGLEMLQEGPHVEELRREMKRLAGEE